MDCLDKNIFEYGSGDSSLYWSRKSKEVISIEHDREWYEKVKLNASSNDNQILLYKEDSVEYESSILNQDKKFDVVIIDGIRRVECSRVIEKSLNTESGDDYMVVLDNSDWYKETSKYLREKLNLIQIDLHGFGPINGYTWTTSIFLSRNFNFKPVNNIQPDFSTSAVKHNAESKC